MQCTRGCLSLFQCMEVRQRYRMSISRIRAVQMNNLRSLLGIRRIYTMPNARVRELCGVTKGVDEKIDGRVVLCWVSSSEK